jgi:hypothetical protein
MLKYIGPYLERLEKRANEAGKPSSPVGPFVFTKYGDEAKVALGITLNRDYEELLTVAAVEDALARLSPTQIAALDIDALAPHVEDPAVFDKYRPSS